MKQLALALFTAALATTLVPSVAIAKGPSEVSVNGPGLASPIKIGGNNTSLAPGSPLLEFAEATGFYPALFVERPGSLLARRPKGELGPRYVARYVVPGPWGEEWRIVQHLYPYAIPDPVTYMAPGQPVYHRKTNGGWFVATSPAALSLRGLLGLPENPPTGSSGGSELPWKVAGPLAALGALLLVGTLAAVRSRRRPQTAATP